MEEELLSRLNVLYHEKWGCVSRTESGTIRGGGSRDHRRKKFLGSLVSTDEKLRFRI